MTNEVLLLISNSITAVASFLVGRRKINAEVENQTLKNLELAVNLYKGIIDDLKLEIRSLNIKVQELEKKIDELHAENKRLKANL